MLKFNIAGLNIIAHFTFLLILLLYFLEEFLKKCSKNLRDNFSKCLKSRERKTRSGAEASALRKCKLFTQMLFLKDTILNCPTASNVIISNSQSVSVEVSAIPQSNPTSSPSSSTRNESVKRGGTANVINESKRSKLSKPSLDTTDQALLELLRKEDKDNMEIPDADVSFANSIVPILQSLPAKKPRLAKINTAGLNLMIRQKDKVLEKYQ